MRVARRYVDHLRQPRSDPCRELRLAFRELAHEGETAGVMRDQMCCQHAVPGGRLPEELSAQVLPLITDAAREDIRAVPEAAKELRHLPGMTERISHVAHAHSSTERRGHA